MISPSLVDQLTHKQDKDWLTQPMLTTSSSSDLIKQRLIKSRNFYHQCLKSVIASLTRTSIQRAQTTKFRKNANMQYHTTAWKVSKSGVFSGPYFPVFGPEQNLFLDTFHAVYLTNIPDINWRNPLLRMNFLDTWKMFHELTLTEKIKLKNIYITHRTYFSAWLGAVYIDWTPWWSNNRFFHKKTVFCQNHEARN